MIEIKRISQHYGTNQVLNDVNLAIAEHKITALIGANGAGKSTLLSVISRLQSPSKGEVFIDGIDIKSLSPNAIALRLAVLKQTQEIRIKLSVYDLVSFGRYPHSKGKLTAMDHSKIEQALRFMHLYDLKDRFIDTLSGGQKQRAYIAMILAQDTDYIFLDEPLNNLDMRYAVEMMTLLQKMVSELHKTIVVVIHDINMAAAFADHIIAMKNGTIIAQGPVASMMTKEVLDQVFDYDFCMTCVNGKNYCLYQPNGKEPIYE